MHIVSHLLAAVIAASAGRAAVAPTVVTIHAKDYAYVGPKSVKASGAITFRLVNDGKEMHHLSIVKLAKGKTMKDVAEALKKQGPPPAWMTDVGGPNPAMPGKTAEATLNLEPAEYAFLCFINTPGNPMPHMAKGMIGSITVEADGSGPQQAGAPSADVTMHAMDYKFETSKPLAAGKHVINFVNDAKQSHEVVMVRMNDGKTVADLVKWAHTDMMKGPPPGEPVGGMAGLAGGRSGTFPVELKAGKYALLCFVPDAKDGKGHFEHGMAQEIVVK